MQLQNKMQSLNMYTMTAPRVRRKKSLNTLNIAEDREEILERRLPGDDLYLPLMLIKKYA